MVKGLVHGDDFVSEAPKKDLMWFDEKLREHFELKTEIPGPKGHKDPRESGVLPERTVLTGQTATQDCPDKMANKGPLGTPEAWVQ